MPVPQLNFLSFFLEFVLFFSVLMVFLMGVKCDI